jgi:hypothetical protein
MRSHVPDEATLLTIQLRLAKNVDSFGDLLMVAAGLSEVDMLASYLGSPPFRLGKNWPRRWRDDIYPYRFWGLDEPFSSRAQIKSFQISSLPDLTIYCRPEWLTLYVCMYGAAWQTIATYDDFVRNLPRFRSDVVGQLEKLSGVSKKFKNLIIRYGAEFFDGMLELSEQDVLFLLVHIQEARRLLSLVNQKTISSDDLKILEEPRKNDQSTTEESDKRDE